MSSSLKEKNSHIEYKLAIFAIAFLSVSKVTSYTSPLIFIGLAPLFGIYDLYKKNEISVFKFILLVSLTLILGFCAWQFLDGQIDFDTLSQSLFHGILMSSAFVIFWFTDKYAKNKIGFFTVIIYWLAFEYCSLNISHISSQLILSDVLADWGSLISWSEQTGWLGVSLWIVTGNILFYYVLFKGNAIFQGKFRWLSLIYTILFLSIPFLYGYWKGPTDTVISGSINPDLEYLGRTALWVTTLLISYGFVKSQVNK